MREVLRTTRIWSNCLIVLSNLTNSGGQMTKCCWCYARQMFVRLCSAGWIIGHMNLKFSTHIKDHHISSLKVKVIGHRSKGMVTKIKNLKVLVFSLVSEKVVQGQGHEGKGQGRRSRSQRQGQSCWSSFLLHRQCFKVNSDTVDRLASSW